MSSSPTTTSSPTPPSAPSDPAKQSSNSKTYRGSCHCQKFIFDITLSPPLEDPATSVGSCNCSICERNGYLLVFAERKDLLWVSGDLGGLKHYTFAGSSAPKIAHCFCDVCGTSLIADSLSPEYPDTVCVNVRVLEGVDLKGLRLREIDGRSI